ncbi:ATP-dependent helicase [Mycoplasma putrefaciens]|uniref:DNA 3'-5' helicase n=1 Tax=Mycoplasma putrefaciens (strain ATCC 15718 / NCTC 10155 / C30 KS-1 / KS-1) TaxID=743965 RepID=A0A7U3ZT18_MYCPK|nr:UvrD-helicase domain-containing protein [Mycoplasma putrefaciens]AEM68971.1 ATP-dependent DNA helicase PcrA [Mycoplasma putrefaciens KS1]
MSINKILDSLNPQQLVAVVTTDKPVRIIAAAGSGKTRVITAKVAYLIENLKIKPSRILAVTFTNKAAKEMKSRVLEIVGDDSKSVFISTFHSWCCRVLRSDGSKIGLEKNFSIIDSDDQKTIIKRCVRESNIILTEEQKRIFDKQILYKIKQWKENLYSSDEALKDALNTIERYYAVIYKLYDQKLKESNSLDFDDLQIYVYKLFDTNPEVLVKWKQAYDYVMVDEFQDTNEIQFALIKFLTKDTNHLTVVGDPDQTIYSWRGAKVDIILNFSKVYPNAVSIFLNQNYRSTQQIVNISNGLINKNKNREQKVVFTNNNSGKKAIVKECDSRQDEARYVASQIKQLVKQGYQYKDFFILHRINAWSQEFEKELFNQKIPFQLIGGIKFRERKVIKDAMAFLKMISIKDSIASERVLGLIPKIGSVTIKKITDLSEQEKLTIFDLLVSDDKTLIYSITKQLDDLSEVLKTAHQMFLNNDSVENILRYLLVNTGYEEKLKITKDDENLANINAFYDQLKNFDNDFNSQYYLEENKLIAFLQEESLTGDADEQTYSDKVLLLTVHAAKGLENKVVFIVGVNQGIFPSKSSVNIQAEIEEERRTFYVALTRAKEQLYLSYIKGEYSYIMKSELLPSKFIFDLDKTDYQFESKFINSLDYQQPRQISKKISPTINPQQFVDFQPGDMINHILFGNGMVLKATGLHLEIAFENKNHGIMMIRADNPALSKRDN